jgi:site-specific DNA-methyltransferase (adenine-specific)
LQIKQGDLSGVAYQFLEEKATINFENEIKKLPYIFKDPHGFDKKIDLKKLQFGSKLDREGKTNKEEFFTVKEIISPEKIKLSNNLIVKLIGIKEDPIINGKATSFLIDKTKGKRVFMRYDMVKYDSENNLLCYLYLENKTFLNAHLIKYRLAKVDSETDFKYKQKFFNLLKEANV